MATYEIIWHQETVNRDAYYQLKRNGIDFASFSTRERAEDCISDLKNTVVLRTKKIESYFRGVLRKGYFPAEGKYKWYVDCESYAGGKPNILQITDYRTTSKKALLGKIREYKRKHSLILERTSFA